MHAVQDHSCLSTFQPTHNTITLILFQIVKMKKKSKGGSDNSVHALAQGKAAREMSPDLSATPDTVPVSFYCDIDPPQRTRNYHSGCMQVIRCPGQVHHSQPYIKTNNKEWNTVY